MGREARRRESGGVASTGAAGAVGLDAWDRWWWLWNLIFFGLLLVATALALADGAAPPARRAAVAILSLTLAGWYWTLAGRAPETHDALRRMQLYLAGTFVLWLTLVWLDPVFYLLLFVLYGQIYGLLPLRWSIPVALLLSGGLVARTFAADPSPGEITGAILTIIGSLVGVAFAVWISAIISQSRQRRALIEELATARRDLIAAEREAGVMAERQRLAGEIHDTLAQGFVSVVTHLEAAEAALDRTPAADLPTLRRHLDDARRAARENLTEARRLVWALRPELLVGGALPDAIGRVARRWAEESGIAAEIATTGTPRALPPEREVALLRAAQEALANVRKHASARHVAVTLSYLDDTAILDVQDDGRGFDPARLELPAAIGDGGGFGLRAMRERVAALGGTLTIESAPGEGTTLAIELPVGEGGPLPPAPSPTRGGGASLEGDLPAEKRVVAATPAVAHGGHPSK